MFKSNTTHIAWRIAQNDWLGMRRNRTTIWILVGTLLTLTVTVLLSAGQFQTAQAQLETATKITQSQWDAQPDRHPHRVSHFGDFVFKPMHPLSQFDQGINSFTGHILFLEPHRQNSANFSDAFEGTALIRFGELTPAFALQIILPLMIIFLGFSTIATEREQGTLQLLIGNGVALHHLLFGKWLSLFIPSALLLLTLIILGLSTCYPSTDALLRLAILSLAYIAYLIFWCSLVVFVSIYSRTAYSALLALIAIWLTICVAMPRLSAEIATQRYPTLSLVEANFAAELALKSLGNSHNPNDPHYKKFKVDLLKKYQVDQLENLPFNYNGLLMQESERLSTQVYREQHALVTLQMHRQNSILDSLIWLNPTIALQKISRSACGTDLAHYLNFLAQAEQRRYTMTQYLNNIHTHNIKQSHDGEQRASAVFWKKAPRQAITTPSIKVSTNLILKAFLGILFWLMTSFFALFWISKRGVWQ